MAVGSTYLFDYGYFVAIAFCSRGPPEDSYCKKRNQQVMSHEHLALCLHSVYGTM